MRGKYYTLILFAAFCLATVFITSCESQYEKDQKKAHERFVSEYKKLFNYNVDSVFKIVDGMPFIDSLLETPISGKVIVFTNELNKSEPFCPLAYRAPQDHMAYDIKDLENVIIQEFYQDTNDDYLKLTCINLPSKKIIKRVIIKGSPIIYENKNRTAQYTYGRMDVQQVAFEMNRLFTVN